MIESLDRRKVKTKSHGHKIGIYFTIVRVDPPKKNFQCTCDFSLLASAVPFSVKFVHYQACLNIKIGDCSNSTYYFNDF